MIYCKNKLNLSCTLFKLQWGSVVSFLVLIGTQIKSWRVKKIIQYFSNFRLQKYILNLFRKFWKTTFLKERNPICICRKYFFIDRFKKTESETTSKYDWKLKRNKDRISRVCESLSLVLPNELVMRTTPTWLLFRLLLSYFGSPHWATVTVRGQVTERLRFTALAARPHK